MIRKTVFVVLVLKPRDYNAAVQRQKAICTYSVSQRILSFSFVEKNTAVQNQTVVTVTAEYKVKLGIILLSIIF